MYTSQKKNVLNIYCISCGYNEVLECLLFYPRPKHWTVLFVDQVEMPVLPSFFLFIQSTHSHGVVVFLLRILGSRGQYGEARAQSRRLPQEQRGMVWVGC